MVVIPSSIRHTRRVAVDKVHTIICNRVNVGDEQYLVRWHTENKTSTPPLSWHLVNELQRCLEHVQDYLDERERSKKIVSRNKVPSKKRKSSEEDLETKRRLSPFDRRLQHDSRTPSASRSSSVFSNVPPASSTSPDVYNGVLDVDEHGFVFCRPASGPDVASVSITNIPTAAMKQIAYQADVRTANTLIRAEYVRRLRHVPGPPIELFNTVDASTPSLRFRYIPQYVLAEGVYQYALDTAIGCQKCSPRMARDVGCEYTQKCDCLEYAAVDEGRLTSEEKKLYERCLAEGLSTMGLPKKFPYYAKDTKIRLTRGLVPWYLQSRRPIYECNDRCRCGADCRNKNVQFGRKVEVEIFKTKSGRGWGLRCKQNLRQGQFIDTYRGEVITDEEATRRENTSSKAKASYLYSLDKFEADMQHEAYVVDGEFMGGPTKFINHSCEPNCRQYTVSYNKNDPHIYDIAFFACRNIPAYEELTFDYLDKEEDEEMEDPGEDAIPCLCGAAKCRKWLWT
ncbi:SET domain-containing protein [Macroventuria anomochaeta]|uniref:SET domain-containing protein n=1 Tax=Macroventuria anomochaeta TaxID=301207 RepID=A0ACB6SD59_9PLEO|nr:SET domain-containing protein [Macroventuria anomochaeta]KAF2631938.1 SET domain-containing protein [Macroventuria anomochaeta]